MRTPSKMTQNRKRLRARQYVFKQYTINNAVTTENRPHFE